MTFIDWRNSFLGRSLRSEGNISYPLGNISDLRASSTVAVLPLTETRLSLRIRMIANQACWDLRDYDGKGASRKSVTVMLPFLPCRPPVTMSFHHERLKSSGHNLL